MNAHAQEISVASPRCWLITGGAGYIGSHIVRTLRERGHHVVVVDDLSSGDVSRLATEVPLVRADVADRDALVETIRAHGVEGIIHLAGKKSGEESIRLPLLYWKENVGGFRSVLDAVALTGIRSLVFSSSSAVYGQPARKWSMSSLRQFRRTPMANRSLPVNGC